MGSETLYKSQPALRDSAPMLAALGMVAYVASMMTHEALGHGAYCVALGGRNVMLTAWGEGCSMQPRGIEAAGPAMQCGAGLLAWAVLRRLPPGAARLRYLLWVYMAFDLLVSSGYVVFSGVTDFGDAAVLIAGLHPPVAWRAGLIVLGSLAYYLSMRALATELKVFAGFDVATARLKRLAWTPYVSAAVLACCGGALNQTMGNTLGLAAASSFGGGFGLLFLPDMQRGMAAKRQSPTVRVAWSPAWGGAAALVIVTFLLFIGPGLKWPA